MGDFQETNSATQAEKGSEDQASLVVGKIKPGEGLWGALEQIAGTDIVRNGVLVVFSQEASGRLGVFSNRYITGGVVDASSDTGIKAIKSLLAVTNGMFCFRPCLADETGELGQKISISIKEVLELRHDKDKPAENPADTLTRIKLRQVEAAVNNEFLSDVADAPVEVTVVNTGPHKLSDIEAAIEEPKADTKDEKSASDTKASKDGDKKETAAEKPPELPPALPPELPPELPPPLPPQASEAKEPSGSESASTAVEPDGSLDYLGWVERQNQDQNSPNLRKILLPATRARSEKEGIKEQVARDIDVVRKALQQEEDKVRRDIEKTLQRAATDPVAKQTLADMELLAGMLHSQEELLGRQEKVAQQRWDGLDDIPTPKSTKEQAKLDASGQTRPGTPVRSTRDFLTGCEDLVTSSVRIVDAKKFIETGQGSEALTEHPWLNRRTLVALSVFGIVGLVVAGISTQLTGMDVRNCLKEGKEHLLAQRWKNAALTFTDALIKDPNCSQAYFYRGIAEEELGLGTEAEKDFKIAQSRGISAAEIATAQAGSAVRHEQWQTVINICDHAISDGQKTPEMYRMRANAYLHVGAFKEAKADCDSALSVCKDDDQKRQIIADRGFAKIQLKDFVGGAEDFDAVLKEHPDSAIYMLKGDAYRKVGKFAEALKNYTLALDLDPRNYDAYVARGISEAAMHQNPEALKDFGRALEIDHNGVEALIQRGSLQLSLGAYRLAVTDLQLAWDLNPTVEETRQKLMTAYARTKKDVPKTLALKSDRKLPSDPKQLVILGYNYLSQGDLDAAIDALDRAIKKEPNNADARRYLAHAFAKSGDFENAAAQFKVLASLQGLTEDDTLIYADALDKAGNSQDAASILTRTLTANQDNATIRTRLAQLYYRNGSQKAGDQVAETGLQRAKSFEERQKYLELMYQGAHMKQFKNVDMGTATHG